MLATIPWFQQPALHLGPLTLYGFGLMVALGFMVGGRIAMDRARRVGLIPEHINTLIGYYVISVFVGGHIGYGLWYEPEEFMADPIRWLKLWDGLASSGGLVMCVAISIWYFRKYKLHAWAYLDCCGIGLAAGWVIGRLGCFLAHDHPGTVTDFFLGVQGICQLEGVCNAVKDGPDCITACHDMGLYESLWMVGVASLFFLLDRKPRVPGFYALMLGLLYGPARLFMDNFRPEGTDVRWLGITPAQYWSLILIVGCGAALVRRLRSGDEPVWAPYGTKPTEEEAA